MERHARDEIIDILTGICDVELRESERKLLKGVLDKQEIIRISPRPLFVREAHAADPTLAREGVIGAKLLRCLAANTEVQELMGCQSLRLSDAYIEGELDFDSLTIPIPLVFKNCYIPGGIELRDAKTRLLSFKGSHTGRIRASRLHVDSSLGLNDGFWARGGVYLHGAVVVGDLDCRHARFERGANGDPVTVTTTLSVRAFARGEEIMSRACSRRQVLLDEDSDRNECALMAEDMDIGADAYLTDIEANGRITLSGAKIRDDLDVRGSRIGDIDGRALIAERIEVGGNVLLGGGPPNINIEKEVMVIRGLASFVDAKIEGNLYCKAVRLDRDGQIVLDTRQSNIKGSAFFGENFWTNGLVRLTGSAIGGGIYFNGAAFASRYRTGIIGKHIKVNGTFAWTSIGGDSPLLQLDLRYSKVGHLEDDEDSWPSYGNLLLNGLVYDSLAYIELSGGPSCPAKSVECRAKRLIAAVKSRLDPAEPRPSRVRWLERQMSHRLTPENVVDYRALADSLLHKEHAHAGAVSESVISRFRGMLLDEDAHRIRTKGVGSKLSAIDQRELLLGLNFLLNDPHLSEGGVPPQSTRNIKRDHGGYGNLRIAMANLNTLRSTFAEAISRNAPIIGYFKPQPYEQLAAFLAEEGDKGEARRTLIAKEDARRRFSGFGPLLRAWLHVLRWTVAYGYKPYYAGAWAAIFIAMGAVIFHEADESMVMIPAKEYVYARTPAQGEPRLPLEYPDFHPIMYSLDVFLPVVDLHQQSYWLPAESEIQRGRWIKKPPDKGGVLPDKPKASASAAEMDLPPRANISKSRGDGDHRSRDSAPGKPSVWLHVWLWLEIVVGWVLTSLFVAGVLGFLHTSELPETENHPSSR